MQCKHYHEKKQSINSRRRELHSMLINVTPTNVGKSFSNINNTEVTLTNMYGKISRYKNNKLARNPNLHMM